MVSLFYVPLSLVLVLNDPFHPESQFWQVFAPPSAASGSSKALSMVTWGFFSSSSELENSLFPFF